MSRLREAWSRVRLAALATPGLRVMLLAIRNYVMHQSANQAGSLAFSSVLAMFPLLVLLSASAGFFGQPGDAAALADRVMEYAPQAVRDAMQPLIKQVLAQRTRRYWPSACWQRCGRPHGGAGDTLGTEPRLRH